MKRLELAWRAVAASLVTVLIGGCAGGPNKPEPRPLLPLPAPDDVAEPAWNQRIGAVRFPLSVATAGGAFTVASSDGTVVALDTATGAERWRASLASPISAGVGSDGRFAAVVLQAGDLVLLEAGQVKWRKPVGTRVVTAPLVAGERVFVLGVDRTVHAYDALDGRKLWTLQRPGDPLTLAQSGVLAAFKNTLLVGQGPRLAGIDPLAGSVRWEAAVGSPRGANEVERLADLIGPPARIGNSVCARAFQAAVGCVDAERGALAWSRSIGGTSGVAGDADYVFAADASDRLTAWRLQNGDVAWTSDAFLHRGFGGPAIHASSVLYGDATGLMHWLRREDGMTRLRLPTDGSGSAAPPAVAGAAALVVTRSGGLYAFRAR